MTERPVEWPGAAGRLRESGAAAPGRGGRMPRQRKRDAVLRLLRGGESETVSRSLGVTAARLTSWGDAFLAASEASLVTQPADGEALESGRLKAERGEMLLKRELLEAKIAALEAGGPSREAEAISRTASPPPSCACRRWCRGRWP